MNKLLIFFFLNVFAAQAQKDSVYLADIQSSECGGEYRIEAHFTSKKTIGDTTYITLSCTNNCSGYHHPKVFLSADSVKIDIGYGLRTKEDKMFYRINGKLMDSRELSELEAKNYPEKYDRSDSTFLTVVTEWFTTCDCCFTFDLKIVGLDSLRNYQYFYNDEFINPNYQEIEPGIPFKFDHYFKQSPNKVSGKIGRIISGEKAFRRNPFVVVVDLALDTLNCEIKGIQTNLGSSGSQQVLDKKLKHYLYSLSPVKCFRNPNTSRLLDKVGLIIEYDRKTKKTIVSCEPQELLKR
ncbi:MAG: hypothetical protein ACO1N0_09460 [Fluviicola sp.]